MWAGFFLAFGLTLYNGLAFLYPSITSIPLGITDLKPLFTQKPWSAIDWFPVTFYPLAIGLCYLLPLDLLFSCWLFFLLWKAQMVVSNMMAWDTVPEFPFVKEQGFGAVMGLFLFYLWSGRKTYIALLRRGWKNKDSSTLAQEGLSDRMAILGIGVGLVGLFLFGLAVSMTWWVILAFFTLYLALLLVVTRIRAECGSPVHDFTFMGPDNILSRALGTTTFRQSDLAFFALSYPLTYSRSNDPMPIALEAQQMARLKGMDARKLFRVVLFTLVFGTFCTFWAYEHQAYQLGAAAKWSAGTHFAQESYDRMTSWTGGTLDAKPNQKANIALLFGFVTTLCLMALRWRYFGFPLHPIGYAVSSAWAINLVWVPMIIAWVLKGLTLRYGGLRTYRLFIPFFLGLVLGDCVMGCAWGLISLLLKMRTYNFFGA